MTTRMKAELGRWFTRAVLVAAVSVMALAVCLPGRVAAALDPSDRQIAASHIRSVGSLQGHEVSPQGFVLAGKRTDGFDNLKLPALVYRRGSSVVSLWISKGTSAQAQPVVSDIDGVHLAHWSRGGMTYRAVSDLSGQDFRDFLKTLHESH